MAVDSSEDYVELAVSWGNGDKGSGLAGRPTFLEAKELLDEAIETAPLFNTRRWVADWEVLAWRMWEGADNAPQQFLGSAVALE
jgi:predicted O-linked N-acetylglucosamine transferase (SPINDLY family)